MKALKYRIVENSVFEYWYVQGLYLIKTERYTIFGLKRTEEENWVDISADGEMSVPLGNGANIPTAQFKTKDSAKEFINRILREPEIEEYP